MSKIEVNYKDPKDENVLQGYLCTPKNIDELNAANKRLPAVLVIHAFEGITDYERGRCRQLADLGYVAFAADVYGRENRGSGTEECFAIMKKFADDRPGLLRRRLLAALDTLKALSFVNAARIGAIGFCFGGMCALDLARVNAPGLAAAVSFHGRLGPLPDQPRPDREAPIQASVLICHGDADSHLKFDEQCVPLMAEMRARKADWQFVNFANAKHGFTEPKNANSPREGIGYDQRADRRSWAAMAELFRERLDDR